MQMKALGTPGTVGKHRRRNRSRRAGSRNDRRRDGTRRTRPRSPALLGLTRQEIQALPDARYGAFLEGVLQSLRGALAPTA